MGCIKVLDFTPALLLLLLTCQNTRVYADEYSSLRKLMVDSQIKMRGISDQRVLNAMMSVPRHIFVPPEQVPYAYEDRPLPIGEGQTISQPYIVALMCEKLSLKPEDKVLEIGTGSGYHAAVISKIVKEVYTVEIIPTLGQRARELLEKKGYTNIKVKIGDGYYGWDDYAPFDAIVVTAAATHIPPPLIKQLKPGGRMVIPVGDVFHVQTLLLVKKSPDGAIKTESICPVRFVPLRGGQR